MVEVEMRESSSSSEDEVTDDVIAIARALASNTLKERNVAFKRLETFLFDQSDFILDSDSALKVWKGLFFMLWHSDGYMAQENLCKRLGRMLTRFQNVKNRMNFLQGAVCIINREWMGIDRLRMDKYMLVLRQLFRASLECLAKDEWNVAHIDWLIGVLGCSPLQHQQATGKEGSSPLGIRYHFADMWVEELIKAGGSNSDCPLTQEKTLPLIKCWIKIAVLTNIDLLRKRINEKVFEDLIERSDVSLKLMEESNPDSPILAELKEEGTLDVDFDALYTATVELSSSDEVKSKQRKAMYGIAKRFQSIASGEVPLDDIEEWQTQPTEIDKFLYQSEHSFSKKELSKMKGLKSAATINEKFVKQLEKFIEADNDDEVIDERIQPKLKKKRKSKQQKIRERAERRRKLMREVLEDERKNEQEDLMEENNNSPEVADETQEIVKKPKKQKSRKAKKLDILSTDDLLSQPTPEEPATKPVENVENEEIEVPLRKKPKTDNSTSKLADLADRIRQNIDQGHEESTEEEPKAKKQKPLKGENFDFAKVNPAPQPRGSAFMTRAQRKAKRGKIEKSNAVVSKASVKKMMEKSTKLKFDAELCKYKPFRKLDKPEVVGVHQGKLKVHDPEKTPTKSALKVKTTPKRVGKVKWQG